ncbi:MAG: hypothetical protein PHW93_05125 [Candidatus Methanomethylophilaceae archaeon]|nr:hypothetical protein [Candidatus Methanomethylophilaceae archaeon]
MRNLSSIVDEIQAHMEELEVKRELSLAMSRQIVRKTKRVIHALHKGEHYHEVLLQAEQEMRELEESLRDSPQIWNSGAVYDAMMELAEAAILVAVIEDRPLPTPQELHVQPASWVLGLGDAIGEMRRRTLDLLRDDDTDGAEAMLLSMEELFAALLSFDSPDAILPARRKQDVARSLLEKTRADVTANAVMRRSREHRS